MKQSPMVLDACCGSRMFWFDNENENAVFVDKRYDSLTLCDGRALCIHPDQIEDFTKLSFADERFAVVVFDPPHLVKCGKNSWLAKKYGKLEGDWKEELRRGFSECFRVLKQHGVLIFKWNETDIPVSQILALTPETPLIGNRCGKASKSHWIAFLKGSSVPSASKVRSRLLINKNDT